MKRGAALLVLALVAGSCGEEPPADCPWHCQYDEEYLTCSCIRDTRPDDGCEDFRADGAAITVEWCPQYVVPEKCCRLLPAEDAGDGKIRERCNCTRTTAGSCELTIEASEPLGSARVDGCPP